MQILSLLVGFATQIAAIKFSTVSPLHCGIARLCRARLCWQLLPLLIEALPIDSTVAASKTATDVHRLESRALLTQLLPLWCREDAAPLSPKQQNILLKELKDVTFAGAGKKTFDNSGAASLSAADADFCLAVLDALRYLRGNCLLDKHTRATLDCLPGPIHAEDVNRRYVQEAAQAVLVQSDGL